MVVIFARYDKKAPPIPTAAINIAQKKTSFKLISDDKRSRKEPFRYGLNDAIKKLAREKSINAFAPFCFTIFVNTYLPIKSPRQSKPEIHFALSL